MFIGVITPFIGQIIWRVNFYGKCSWILHIWSIWVSQLLIKQYDKELQLYTPLVNWNCVMLDIRKCQRQRCSCVFFSFDVKGVRWAHTHTRRVLYFFPPGFKDMLPVGVVDILWIVTFFFKIVNLNMDGHKEAVFGVQGDHLQEGVVVSFLFILNFHLQFGTKRNMRWIDWKPSWLQVPAVSLGGISAFCTGDSYCILHPCNGCSTGWGIHDSWDVFFLSKNRSRLEWFVTWNCDLCHTWMDFFDPWSIWIDWILWMEWTRRRFSELECTSAHCETSLEDGNLWKIPGLQKQQRESSEGDGWDCQVFIQCPFLSLSAPFQT